MDLSQINEKLKEIIKIQLKDQNKKVEDLIHDIKSEINITSSEISKDLINDLDLLDLYNKSLQDGDLFDNPEKAFRAITIIGNIDSELDIINAELTPLLQLNTPKYQVISGFINKIKKLKNWISKTSNHLWQFLSQMMNLNGWSISGNHSSNILGYSNGVSLQLNFGS